MKILLVGINSKYIHSNPAIYYLRTYAINRAKNKEQFSESIEIAEYTINQEKCDVLRDIFMHDADVVAFSCYLWNITFVYSIISALSSVSPDTDIWLGGPEVSFDPENQLKKYPQVRGILAGEGEEIFYNLASEYIEKGTGENLPKVMFAGDLDFDEVPFPYEDLSNFKNKIIYYETSRGCPFGCSYCLSSVDKKVRLRNIDLVKSELKIFLDARVPQVKFVDRTFNCNPKHTKEILEFIKNNDNGVTNFHFEMAADLITDEELDILATFRPGLVQIEVGIQTTNCDTLTAINRKAKTELIFDKVRKLLLTKKMHIHVDLIAGLPYEDLKSFRNSFNEVYGLHANELQLGFLKILKGSPMESEAAEYGIEYLSEPPYEVLKTNCLSFSDIIQLKAIEEMVEVYYNSGQFINSMAMLENAFEDYFSLYKAMADYYSLKGFDKIKLTRYDRYKILRDFVLESDLKEISISDFTEVLLHDLYLRDNVKSRPDYGTEGLVDKNDYHEFFASGRYKKYLSDYDEYTFVQASKMVHIEKRKTGYYLYDYRKRDPLTENAMSIFLGNEL